MVPSVCVRRAERGRVDRRAGENSEHRRHVESRKPADERRAGRAEQNNDRGREQIEFHALMPQRRKKPGPKLQARS